MMDWHKIKTGSLLRSS